MEKENPIMIIDYLTQKIRLGAPLCLLQIFCELVSPVSGYIIKIDNHLGSVDQIHYLLYQFVLLEIRYFEESCV